MGRWSEMGHPEIIGVYSITSSARTSSHDGTVNPSALAGLEVNCQLVLCRCLRWQIGRFLAF